MTTYTEAEHQQTIESLVAALLRCTEKRLALEAEITHSPPTTPTSTPPGGRVCRACSAMHRANWENRRKAAA